MDKINIDLSPSQNIFFTSDLHFGHRRIIEFCSRPYSDEKEMGRALIDNWNSVVSPRDIVFNLGDFCWWDSRHTTRSIINKLNGTIYMVLGNHDTVKQFELCDSNKVILCSDITILYLRTLEEDTRFDSRLYEIVCSHFPLMCYSHSEHKNVYNFFGHIHSLKDEPMTEFGEFLPLKAGKQLDVGVDRHNWTPCKLEDLLKEIKDSSIYGN